MKDKSALGIALLAASIGVFGCSSGDNGGTGATGGGGSGNGLSFDEETSAVAAAATANAMAFSAQFAGAAGVVVGAVVGGPVGASIGLAPKTDVPVPELCQGGGSASVDWDNIAGNSVLSVGDVITALLSSCVGADGKPISGMVTIVVEGVSSDFNLISFTVTVEDLTDETNTMNGEFFASVDFARVGQLIIRLGDLLDSDSLTVDGPSGAARLGCFEFVVVFDTVSPTAPELIRITPLGVAALSVGQYTINDYALNPPFISFDGALPDNGTVAMTSGDLSDAGSGRTGKCNGFGGEGDETFAVATFMRAPAGCVLIQGEDDSGSFERYSSWDKLVAGDTSPGGGPGCEGGGTGGTPGFSCGDVPANAFVIEDSDFPDSNWSFEVVKPDMLSVDVVVTQQMTGGVGGGRFRQMVHDIGVGDPCTGECRVGSMATVHEFVGTDATYDPGVEGAISRIDYSEVQRVIQPAFEGAAVGWAIAVIQGGTRYNAVPDEPITSTEWVGNGLCGLTADDFGPADGPHPNFTASGDPLTFVYIRSNTNNSESSNLRNVHGIDDLKFVVVPE